MGFARPSVRIRQGEKKRNKIVSFLYLSILCLERKAQQANHLPRLNEINIWRTTKHVN